jgi:type II secretory pathway pseudopilin PulG
MIARTAWPRTGVTLVELVVALAVFGLATGVIFGVVGMANRSSMTAQQIQELQYNVRLAVERLEREVRWGGAPQGRAGGFLAVGPTAFAVTIPADPEWPACARPCRPYPAAAPGRAYAVRFSFDPDSRTLRRQIDDAGAFDEQGWRPGGWAPPDGEIVADHVAGVQFSFFDRDGALAASADAAFRLSMRIEVQLGRHARAVTSDVYLRQK